MDTVPTVDRCKAEIRKKGAKLEANRKSTAVRKARMTHQDVPVWSHPVEYQSNPFEEEGLRIIQAAIANRNAQRPKDP